MESVSCGDVEVGGLRWVDVKMCVVPYARAHARRTTKFVDVTPPLTFIAVYEYGMPPSAKAQRAGPHQGAVQRHLPAA